MSKGENLSEHGRGGEDLMVSEGRGSERSPIVHFKLEQDKVSERALAISQDSAGMEDLI